ncbi:alpha/beta fold hydrolase [Pseudarthrobacter sp. J1738]|uniref:S9 family peptidase n=1 Tax=Pseudarthrobacter sp. J1738 TaxID=3420446 RepID=UPI003D29907E
MTSSTPFHNMDHYLAIPRVSGLALSPDGKRLVTTVATLNNKATEYKSALWELDPEGARPARRITRSAKGEAGAVFTASGDLYFTSARPDPETSEDDPVNALWLLPAAGGEARVVLSRAGGISEVLTASAAEATFVSASVLPGAADESEDEERRKSRKDKSVAAILHSGYPVRYWDADLGPAEPRLFAIEPDTQADTEKRADAAAVPTTVDALPPLKLRNLTPHVRGQLRESHSSVSPDGKTIYTTLNRGVARGDMRGDLVSVDTESGTMRTLLDTEGLDFYAGPVSPDNGTLAFVAESHTTPQEAPRVRMNLLDVATGQSRELAPDWDRWGHPVAWLPDGSSVLVTADDDGASPLFAVSVADGAVTRVTKDASAYTNVLVAPDGKTAYALRSSYEFPSEVVRIDLASGEVTRLQAPAERPSFPGKLERVETAAADGVRVPGYLALPEGASEANPAPLLLWIHGGPLGSWNAWTWRWNPWLLTAKGYAVLLPDPALSTGYGQDYIQRGWGDWGKNPYTDLMALTDAVEKRTDIDHTRTAAMGGSFGGYMANWVAGNTDRFKAIVTHASLWALDQFGATTDAAMYWLKEMTPEMIEANSPHHHVENISTPMLVVHGDKDYRVPIGEGLRLWYELLSKSKLAADDDGKTPHRFLYFPDENHWVLQPQHSKVWYGVVEQFLAKHVLDKDLGLPETLGL